MRRIVVPTFLLMFGLIGAQLPASAHPPEGHIVVLKDDVPDVPAVAADHAQRFGASLRHLYEDAIKGYAAVIPPQHLAHIQNDPRVLFVTEDRAISAFAQTVPTGVQRIQPTGPVTNMAAVTGIEVAVIDTGSGPHPDLNVVGGTNCSTGAKNSYGDGNGHGTHVAGTIGAMNNTAGVVGVAAGVPLDSVRVLNNNGSGSWSSVICGIDWVTKRVRNGAPIKVANMSLGGSGSDDGNCGNTNGDALHRAICSSVAAGVTYVVAAGNDGTDFAASVPASYGEVLTVTAMADFNGAPGGGATATCLSEVDDTVAYFSNFAVAPVDIAHTIAAPGVCILSTWKGGGYNTISGTSMATPHVSGAVALCLASRTCPSAPSEIITKLVGDAHAQGATYGFVGDAFDSAGAPYYGYLVDGTY